MFPVWFMSYRKSDSEMTYATVNGSTGKVVADFPISVVKYLIFSGILAAVFFLLFTLIDLMPRPQTSLSLTGLLAMVGLYLNLKAGIKANRKKNGIGAVLERREKKNTGLFFILLFVLFGYIAVDLLMLSVGNVMTLFMMIAVPIADVFDAVKVQKAAKSVETDRSFRETLFKKKALVYFFAAAVIAVIVFVSIDTSAASSVFFALLYLAVAELVLVCSIAYDSYGFLPKTGKSTLLFVAMLLSIAFCVGVLILQPMNEVYYIACVVNAVVFVLGAMDTVIYQNELSYRRPPQFNKTGGDNSAK